MTTFDPRDQAPKRLLEDPSSSSLVRDDLANVAQAAPSYDAAAGLLALQAALGAAKAASAASAAGAAGAGSSTGASLPAAAAKTGLAIKVAVAGGLGVIAIAGTIALSSLSHDALPQPAQPKTPAVARPAAPTSAVEPSTTAPEPAPPPAAIEPVRPEPAPPSAPLTSAASSVPRDRAAAEIAQLAQIKGLIEREPARALRMAEQGNREFKGGYLHHEREGLAIIALHALGRHEQAHARAVRYLERYPNSPLSERVRALEGAE